MALKYNRKAIGIKLKPSYYRQAQKNISCIDDISDQIEMNIEETTIEEEIIESE